MTTARIELPPKLIPVFTAKGKRYRGAYGGRGSGKTRSFAKMAALKAYQLDQEGKRGLIVCGREYMNSLDDSSMSEVKEAIQSEPWLAAHFDIGDRYIRTKSKRIEFAFIGLRHNLESIKSKARIYLLWVDEAEPVTEESWQIVAPTVREHDSEIWVTWNPASAKAPVHKRFRECKDDDMMFVEMNWRDNPWFPEVLEKERQRDLRDRPDDYSHIWEGAFRTNMTGAIYAKQLSEARSQGRICDVPIATGTLVDTFWDLGHNDSNAIWFMQAVGPQYRFIDYYEARLEQLDHYIRVLRKKDYLYGRHYLPHDVGHQILGMPLTRKEQLEAAGIKPIEVVPRIGDLNEGIEMTRRMLASCWFDQTRCADGLDALANYVWKYDETNDALKKPLHNWASNGADAFRQFAQGYSPATAPIKPRQAAFY